MSLHYEDGREMSSTKNIDLKCVENQQEIQKLLDKNRGNSIGKATDRLLEIISNYVFVKFYDTDEDETLEDGTIVHNFKEDFHPNIKESFTEDELVQLKQMIDTMKSYSEFCDMMDKTKEMFIIFR